MTFYNVELDICPAYGWSGGPAARTRIRTLRNGHERRNVEADLSRRRFILPWQNNLEEQYRNDILNAHMAMHGMAHSFKVKDWTDFESDGDSQGLAPSGSTPVQLVRTYTFGPVTRVRPITKPDTSTVVIYQNGTPKSGTTDPLTGLFTPTTNWTPGAALTADFRFWVPVRFDNDFLSTSVDNRNREGYIVNGNVELIEVLGE